MQYINTPFLPMRILLVSQELIAGNLAYLLQNEGCEVKLYIEDKSQKRSFRNVVPKTAKWERELQWVGKDGLIVFDDIGFGAVQDTLRKQGYSVFGGTKLSDKLEENRKWGQEIFNQYGLNTLPTLNFENIRSAISFLKKHPGPWVIKRNEYAPSDINYVGNFENNSDLISVLENYQTNYSNSLGIITLQKRVCGVEIGVGRYFNGEDWVGPIEINLEHKKLFPGEIGPTTSEMGTLAWYDDNENNKLFLETLVKMKPFLKKIDFRGDFEIGCIVNENGVFPLEASPRMGTPIVHLHSEIHISPWHKLLKAIADKKPFDLKWKKGFGIVVLIAAPPFPYKSKMKGISPLGMEVYFDSANEEDYKHIHFEGISVINKKDIKKKYVIADPCGYVLYVTAIGKTVSDARKKTEDIISKIYFPKMFYRNDIGCDFEKRAHDYLNNLGFFTSAI